MEKCQVYRCAKQDFCQEELNALPNCKITMTLMFTHQLSDPEVHYYIITICHSVLDCM